VGPISVKESILVEKTDDSHSMVGGIVGDYQRRALCLVLMQDNKTSRRVVVLGLRT